MDSPATGENGLLALAAACSLEVFLDRLGWRARRARGGSETYLLDARYEAADRPEAENELRRRLWTLIQEATPELRARPAWQDIGRAVVALGGGSLTVEAGFLTSGSHRHRATRLRHAARWSRLLPQSEHQPR